MWVGVGRIVLTFYNNDQLRLKKKNLESLCKELRKEYNLSALEVSDFDDLEKCTFGFAAVMPDSWKEASAKSMIQKICKTIDEKAFGRVEVQDCELYYHG